MPVERAIYWLKRDFRLLDNPALTAALAAAKQVVPVFVLEPSFLSSGDTSAFHLNAIRQALSGLAQQLTAAQGNVYLAQLEVVTLLDQLYAQAPFQQVHAHEETGTERTFARDIAVHNWCQQRGVAFVEHQQTGVFRGLQERNNRHGHWQMFMGVPALPVPVGLARCQAPLAWSTLLSPIPTAILATEWPLPLNEEQRKHAQQVSEQAAEKDLHSFLYERGISYSKGISSPVTAFRSGSRLSVHLAWGTITSRRVLQRTHARMLELKDQKKNGNPLAGKWRYALQNFSSRLHWRDHFIQRLEQEPNMEFQALNAAYDELIFTPNAAHLAAWEHGTTGYPLVDACIRCLRTSGFLNFRMRAMITSFACHILHLDWRWIHEPMARMYADYEPGIHFSQLQMQAGVVGINTLRVYNPTKQILDHDPEAIFIKQWISELRHLSPADILGHREEQLDDYPPQIVERTAAAAIMKDQIYAIRESITHRQQAQLVFLRHGSRKPPTRRRRAKKS